MIFASMKLNLQPATKQPAPNTSAPHVLNCNRLPPVIGSKKVKNAVLKTSSKPREFHVYLGNFELGITTDTIRKYIEVNKVSIRLLHSEVVSSARWHNARVSAAHVVVDPLDKDTPLYSDSWPDNVTENPWRQRRTERTSTWFERDD